MVSPLINTGVYYEFLNIFTIIVGINSNFSALKIALMYMLIILIMLIFE